MQVQICFGRVHGFPPKCETACCCPNAGSPLTHARFLNRYKGTYGPAISAASGSFPGPKTPIKGLYRRAAFLLLYLAWVRGIRGSLSVICI